jgi:predicted regulator of Ras-like GTPase activity (Roadblock/LC7/MglB family)
MIKSKTLTQVLAQACTSGVQAAILFDLNGSMLAFSGSDMVSNQMVTAIVANLWSAFESKEPGLLTMLFDFERGRVAASRTSQFVLCVYGEETVPFGMLKCKTEALAQNLTVPMDQVCEAQGQGK